MEQGCGQGGAVPGHAGAGGYLGSLESGGIPPLPSAPLPHPSARVPLQYSLWGNKTDLSLLVDASKIDPAALAAPSNAAGEIKGEGEGGALPGPPPPQGPLAGSVGTLLKGFTHLPPFTPCWQELPFSLLTSLTPSGMC